MQPDATQLIQAIDRFASSRSRIYTIGEALKEVSPSGQIGEARFRELLRVAGVPVIKGSGRNPDLITASALWSAMDRLNYIHSLGRLPECTQRGRRKPRK